jgi:hypothetical protein
MEAQVLSQKPDFARIVMGCKGLTATAPLCGVLTNEKSLAWRRKGIFHLKAVCNTPSVPNYLTLSTKVFVLNWMTYLSAIQIYIFLEKSNRMDGKNTTN